MSFDISEEIEIDIDTIGTLTMDQVPIIAISI